MACPRFLPRVPASGGLIRSPPSLANANSTFFFFFPWGLVGDALFTSTDSPTPPQDGRAFEHASQEMKNDAAIVMAAVQQDGRTNK